MRTRLSVRQVYKGEIEEKLLNQLGADLTKRIMHQIRRHGKSYFVLFLQNRVILIKNAAKLINCTYPAQSKISKNTLFNHNLARIMSLSARITPCNTFFANSASLRVFSVLWQKMQSISAHHLVANIAANTPTPAVAAGADRPAPPD
jgi:type I site-specific restriction endonuclease